jgi:hypothetical protein
MNKLPADIINHILSYDDRFVIRKGIPVSVIPKNDYRYSLLKQITRTIVKFKKHSNQKKISTIYSYEFEFSENLYEIPNRICELDNDIMYAEIEINEDSVDYSILWFRVKPKDKIIDKLTCKHFYTKRLFGNEWDCFSHRYKIKNVNTGYKVFLPNCSNDSN